MCWGYCAKMKIILIGALQSHKINASHFSIFFGKLVLSAAEEYGHMDVCHEVHINTIGQKSNHWNVKSAFGTQPLLISSVWSIKSEEIALNCLHRFLTVSYVVRFRILLMKTGT